MYLIVSMILTLITVDRKSASSFSNKSIFLHSNGVHLDIAIPKNDLTIELKNGIKHLESANYLSFGWGDEDFYLNTPTWGDLTFKTAFNAMFLTSSTLIHVTRYQQIQTDWIEIKVSESEFERLNLYLSNSFKNDENGMKVLLQNRGYTNYDDFYKSHGSYSCFNTCNSWVNTAFKESGLKACLWTPFDFGLMNKYR
ncbi:TIGR02117 family protein [Seonamhaeicola marinus]|nr:TIGR02117 family protein [Seonamhaeicola marinus]